ncbi:hypothetical protein [Trueperella bernardiae]|uniref:hypothetical protein n=1 Tax=Trueperella bernardiae TaxID=59561 RepID=UPI00294B9084|nr:hypothetical protein [Trueperella bernardiae]
MSAAVHAYVNTPCNTSASTASWTTARMVATIGCHPALTPAHRCRPRIAATVTTSPMPVVTNSHAVSFTLTSPHPLVHVSRADARLHTTNRCYS